MTLEQLRIFVAVAEREHVTQAAREINLTQSAVSAAISTLEARYDIKLFDRIGRRIALTEAGRMFLGEARGVLARAASAEAMLADFAGLKRGHLALAASQTVANYWLPPLLAQFRAAYPGVTTSLTIGNTETVARMVREGEADLGFVEGSIEEAALSITEVAKDQLTIVISTAEAKDIKTPLNAATITALKWVFRERGSGTRAIFEDALTRLGVAASDLDIVLELPSNEAVRTAVIAGAGAAALSQLALGVALQSGTLVKLDFAMPPRAFFALRHKERSLTQAQRALYEMIQKGSGSARHE